jgi:3-oxoacyl-[acyl-carrier protein] reductase
MQTNSDALSGLPRDDRLTGKTAVVTGSTSGIGEAIARVLAASGAELLITGRDKARADQVVERITAAGGTAHAQTVDLAASAAAVRNFAHQAQKALGGRVDILVNNAGIYPVGPTHAVRDDVLDAVLHTNIRAPHTLVGALAPAMATRGTGAIVNIGSWMSRVGVPFTALYPATKAAIEQLTRAWAAEYGPQGVRVNTIAPGATATPGNKNDADALTAMTKNTVAGRPVRPVDIGYAVRFAVSDEAAFLHGATIDVDGGMTNARLN